MKVAVHQLKASLSKLLARAQSGEIIEVTSHQRPIARIVGIPKSTEEPLNSMILNGSLSWNGQKPALEPPIQLLDSGKLLSSLIQEDRR